MKNIKHAISETELTQAEISSLQETLNLKSRKLAKVKWEELIRCARDTIVIPPEVVESTRQYIVDWLKQDNTISFEEVLADDDYLQECMENCKIPLEKPLLWVEVEEADIRCNSDECWYFEHEPGRRDEHKSNFYHAGDHDTGPVKVYCDVCFFNVEDVNDSIDDEWEWTIPAMRKCLQEK